MSGNSIGSKQMQENKIGNNPRLPHTETAAASQNKFLTLYGMNPNDYVII
jgi:hypothetical protein